MDSTTQAVSPLRQRMLDDMRMRKFSPKTQSQYIRSKAVRRVPGPVTRHGYR
jgi:integrase/recombinase XerD